MMLRKKLFAAFAATVFALSMMVGSAMASTDKLPFVYGNEAGVATNNDVWVVLYGGAAATPATDDTAVRDSIVSVDVIVNGHATFDGEVIANTDSGWNPTSFSGTTVNGETTLSIPFPAKDAAYAEVVVSLHNKSEGDLQITRIDYKDAAGKVVLSHGGAAVEAGEVEVEDGDDEVVAEAPVATETKSDAKAETKATTSVPKTGVASLSLVFGLGAAVLGTGAVVLKKKEQ